MMITMDDDAHQLCSICMALKMENRPAAPVARAGGLVLPDDDRLAVLI